MYTEKIDPLYLNQAIDELKEYVNNLSTNDETVINKLNDKIARIEDEIETILDNAQEMAEALELIEDALPK